MAMKIYDKASWHIDANELEKDVVERFNKIMQWCDNHNLLTEEGKEIVALGIDDAISLHSQMFTTNGNKFMCWLFESNQNPYTVSLKEMEDELSKLQNR